MYAMDKWKIEPEKIKLIEYNLLANQATEFFINKTEIENSKAYISGSVSDMQSLLIDVKNNTPKEEDKFPKVEDEKIRANCNFKKVCIEG